MQINIFWHDKWGRRTDISVHKKDFKNTVINLIEKTFIDNHPEIFYTDSTGTHQIDYYNLPWDK